MKTTNAKKMSGLEMAAVAAGVLGVGYLLLKPKEAKAAAPPATSVTCWDGSTAPTLADCPLKVLNVPPAFPEPIVMALGSGLGPILPGQAPFGLTGLPPVNVTPDPVTEKGVVVGSSDRLVFLQGYDATLQPLFPDPPSGTPIGGILRAPTADAQSLSLPDLLDPKNGAISFYFDPIYANKLEAPNTLVLIWTTDHVGTPIAWWVTTWKAKP